MSHHTRCTKCRSTNDEQCASLTSVRPEAQGLAAAFSHSSTSERPFQFPNRLLLVTTGWSWPGSQPHRRHAVCSSPDTEWAHAAGRGLATLHGETAALIDTCGLFRVEQQNVQTAKLQPATTEAERSTIDGNDAYHEAAIQYVRGRQPVLDRFGHGEIAEQASKRSRLHPNAQQALANPCSVTAGRRRARDCRTVRVRRLANRVSSIQSGTRRAAADVSGRIRDSTTPSTGDRRAATTVRTAQRRLLF